MLKYANRQQSNCKSTLYRFTNGFTNKPIVLHIALQGLDETFDVAANRSVLEHKLKSLQSEVHQVERLQRKFSTIHSTLQQLQAATDGVGVPGSVQGSIKDKEASSLIAAATSGAQPLGVRAKGVGAVTATRDTGDAALMRDAGAAKAHVVAAPLRVAGAVAAAQAALVAGK